MSAITHLLAGVPVSDLDAGIDWYTRFFGRPPDLRVGDEVLWDVDEHATLFIEPDAARAGGGRITFAVAGLDALLERLTAQQIEHEPIETYSNGVRHVKIPDPDGNAIAFAEPPSVASDAVEAMRRYWEDAFNGRDLSVLDELIADDYVNHAARPGTPPGPAGQAAVMERLWAALSDARFEITHLAADGDVVTCIGTMSGTHDGELLGVPASGRRVEWRMCHILRFDAEGRAIEHSAIRDDLGLMRQMGAL